MHTISRDNIYKTTCVDRQPDKIMSEMDFVALAICTNLKNEINDTATVLDNRMIDIQTVTALNAQMTAEFNTSFDTLARHVGGVVPQVQAELVHAHFELDRKLDRQTRLIYTSLGLLFAMQAATIWLVMSRGEGTSMQCPTADVDDKRPAASGLHDMWDYVSLATPDVMMYLFNLTP